MAVKRQKILAPPPPPGQLLPEVLVEEIFVRLPLKSLLRFKVVCRDWLKLMSSHRFAFRLLHSASTSSRPLVLQYYHHRKFNPISTSITVHHHHIITTRHGNIIDMMNVDVNVYRLFPVGYGIFCGFDFDYLYTHQVVFLWNPTTRQTKFLPTPPPNLYSSLSLGSDENHVCHFGIVNYDEHAADFCYRVGRVFSHRTSYTSCVNLSLELYSSKTNSWKLLPNFYQVDSPFTTFYCANLNGRVHWPLISSDGRKHRYIASFDYETEVFTRIRAPEVGRSYQSLFITVTLFDDKFLSLLLFWPAEDRVTSYVDIWVLRDYEVEDSWTREFTLGPIPMEATHLGFSSKARGIFLHHLSGGLSTRLSIFNCMTSLDMEWFHLPGEPRDQFIKVFENTKSSLVSLSV